MSSRTRRVWLHKLISTIVSGGSGAVTAAFGASIIAPDKFNATTGASGGLLNCLKLMAACFVVNGIIGMFMYLQKSPLPDIDDDDLTSLGARPSSDDPARLPLWILSVGLGTLALPLLTGCTVSVGGKYGLVSKPLNLPAQRIVNVSQATVGINVGMNQATQTPEFQIGYKRFAAQIIPTSTNAINTVPFRVKMGVSKEGFDAGIAETVESGTAAGPRTEGGGLKAEDRGKKEDAARTLLRKALE